MKKLSSNLIFILGLIAVAVSVLPYLILGQDAIFTYHDQLDGEVIAYLLNARHLGYSGPFWEFMGGAAQTALVPPAPLFVLLFAAVDAHVALSLMQFVGSLVGYLGMYYLIKILKNMVEIKSVPTWLEELLIVAISVIYAYLPFLPVYGLSQYGMPLLLACFLWIFRGKEASAGERITEGEKAKGSMGKRVLPWIYIALYGLSSSLVLCGFGILGAIAVAAVVLLIRKKKTGAWRLFGAGALLTVTYSAINIRLLGQVLFGAGETSHKDAYVIYGSKFLTTFWENLIHGKVHTNDSHHLFILVILAAFVVLMSDRKYRKINKALGILLGSIVILCFMSALWDSTLGVALREHLGGLRSFQLNRLLWMTPVLWYVSLALALLGAVNMWLESRQLYVLLLNIAVCGATAATGMMVLLSGQFPTNAVKAVNGYVRAISFSDYYAIGVMEQVDAYIEETTGQKKQDYYVVNFGIDPAAALYHGFYCLDGYSNNYALEYKNQFRKVIAGELDRNDYIRQNFDDWGNRCYVFSSECPGYFTIEKGGFYLKDFRIDTSALREMGGKYLLSAVYIENGPDIGLKLVRENPFETDDSYYRIYLYEIVGK